MRYQCKHARKDEERPSRKRRLLLIPLLTGAALAGGYVFATWSSSGSGTGEAKSMTALDSVISPGTNAADLYPGATSSVEVTISNPNPYAVVVNSISAGSSALVNTTCLAGTVTSDARATDPAGLLQVDDVTTAIPASGTGSYELVTHMGATAADSCQGQTFTLALTAALSSA